MGRWTAKDAALLTGGTNVYVYSFCDSVNFVDTNGREPITVAILTGIAIRAGVGAAAGALGDLIGQAVANHASGRGWFECINGREIGVSALAGAGIGVLGPVSVPAAAAAGSTPPARFPPLRLAPPHSASADQNLSPRTDLPRACRSPRSPSSRSTFGCA